MTPENVIVSVFRAERTCLGDYELPFRVPVGRFKENLVRLAAQSAPGFGAASQKGGYSLCIRDAKGGLLGIDDSRTLEEYNVWDGAEVFLLPSE